MYPINIFRIKKPAWGSGENYKFYLKKYMGILPQRLQTLKTLEEFARRSNTEAEFKDYKKSSIRAYNEQLYLAKLEMNALKIERESVII